MIERPESSQVAAIREAVAGKNGKAAGAAIVRLAPGIGPLADAVEAGAIAIEILTDDAGLRNEREQVLAVLRDRKRHYTVARALAMLDDNVGIGVIAIGTDKPDVAIDALRAEKPLDVIVTRPGDGYYVPRTRTETITVIDANGDEQTEEIEIDYEELVFDMIEERLDADDERFVVHDGHLFAIGFTSDEVQRALLASRNA